MRYAALRTLIAITLGIIIAELLYAQQIVTGHFSFPLIYLIVGIGIGIIFDRLTKGYSLYGAILFASMLNHIVQKPISFESLYNQPVKIVGMIIDEPVARQFALGGPRYTVALKKVSIGNNQYPISGKVLAYPKRTMVNLRYGDVITCLGKIEPFNFPKNPNLLDLNKFYFRRGILGRIEFSQNNLNIIGRNQGNLIAQYLILPLRRYFFKVINHYLAGPARALYAGILLGKRQDLPPKLKLAFTNTGLAHILAVSGLNVGILVGVVILLFSVIGLYRGKFYTLMVLGIIVFLYVGVTGFEPSAVRAGLMAFLCSLGFFLERKTEPLQGVFIAGIIILLLSPTALFEIGFQLSFGATTALILFVPKIYRFLIKITSLSFIRKYLLAPLSVVIAAQLGTAPLLVYYFFKLSIITIFANLLVVPLVGLATPLAFLVAFFHFFAPFWARIFAETLGLTLSAILFITDQLGGIRFASIDLPKPSILLIIFFYTLIFILFHLDRPNFRKALILILLLTLNFWVWTKVFAQSELKITCLDLYSGDASLVELPNHQNILINTGNRKNEILTQFLKSKGIRTIDFLVITNTQSNFYQGLELLNKGFRINKAIIPYDPKANLIDYLPKDQTISLNTDCVLKIDGLGVKLEINSLGKRHHPNPLLIKMEYGNFAIRFAGSLNDSLLPNESLTVLKPSYDKYADWDRILSSVRTKKLIIAERLSIPKHLKAMALKYHTELYNLRTDGALTITVSDKKIKFEKLK